MEITYIDRKTGKRAVEKVYGVQILSFLYGDGHWLRRFFANFFSFLIARISLFSKFYGFLQKRPRSQHNIQPFIAAYGIDASEFATQDFASFNDFFIRKLKPSCRPIVSDPNRLAMPADGRYLVYAQIEKFTIKGRSFDLVSFLQNPALAHQFQQGSIAIIRLCPTDYHRFHFPCDAFAHSAQLIQGALYSVNPIALRQRLSILSENQRMVTRLDTKAFGTILYVEVGATFVGSIRQTFTPNQQVRKGEEKGYFEFGGSCIVLLFEKGKIAWDADLLANSQEGLETLGRFGVGMGHLVAPL